MCGRDWSSDVCSSDLGLAHCWLLVRPGEAPVLFLHAPEDFWHLPARLPDEPWVARFRLEPRRSEERRVGKEQFHKANADVSILAKCVKELLYKGKLKK